MIQSDRERILEEIGESKRTRCTVYTRVMGYHRPVESFNIGKKGEHQERMQFVEPKSDAKTANKKSCRHLAA